MAKGQTSTVARSEKIKDSRFRRLNWSAAFFQVLCMGGGGGQQIIMTNLFMGWSTEIFRG